jgi:hypothetical protein
MPKTDVHLSRIEEKIVTCNLSPFKEHRGEITTDGHGGRKG